MSEFESDRAWGPLHRHYDKFIFGEIILGMYALKTLFQDSIVFGLILFGVIGLMYLLVPGILGAMAREESTGKYTITRDE